MVRLTCLRRPLALGLLWLAALVLAGVPAWGAERFGEGLLWRVTGRGAEPSHVFGTIHLADPRVTRLPSAVAKALDGARAIALETSLDASGFQVLAGNMVYTDGRDLQAVAGEALYGRVVTVAAGAGLPEPAVRMLKPWALSILFSVPPQNPVDVLDARLALLAAEQGKPLRELESMEEQVAVFDAMPEEDQLALLEQTLDGYEDMPRLLGRVVDRYLARDLAGIWRLREASAGRDARARRFNEAFLRRLLHDRNARMAERAQPMLRDGGAFIAVGALHLYGDEGLLALLERRGWRVTRVY